MFFSHGAGSSPKTAGHVRQQNPTGCRFTYMGRMAGLSWPWRTAHRSFTESWESCIIFSYTPSGRGVVGRAPGFWGCAVGGEAAGGAARADAANATRAPSTPIAPPVRTIVRYVPLVVALIPACSSRA